MSSTTSALGILFPGSHLLLALAPLSALAMARGFTAAVCHWLFGGVLFPGSPPVPELEELEAALLVWSNTKVVVTSMASGFPSCAINSSKWSLLITRCPVADLSIGRNLVPGEQLIE